MDQPPPDAHALPTAARSDDFLRQIRLTAQRIAIGGIAACAEGRLEYRNKTSGYRRDETTIIAVLDRDGRELTAVWNEAWQEIAAGIASCGPRRATRSGARETITTQRLRIQRSACPVYVLFSRMASVVPYGRSTDMGDTTSQWWVCYEAGEGGRSQGPA